MTLLILQFKFFEIQTTAICQALFVSSKNIKIRLDMMLQIQSFLFYNDQLLI